LINTQGDPAESQKARGAGHLNTTGVRWIREPWLPC